MSGNIIQILKIAEISHSVSIQLSQLIVERGTSDGNEWRAQCDRSFNMSGTEFAQAHLNLTSGYYRLEFATMLVYHNASDFYNNTLPALHSAFLDIRLPYPSVLVVTLEIELSTLAALLALDYARFCKIQEYGRFPVTI